MARTIAEIQQSIIAAKDAEPTLAVLSSSGPQSIWRSWTFVIAFCTFVLESLFDLHSAEVDTRLAAKTAHRLPWYADMAMKFQIGFDLVDDEDYYDNTGVPEATVAASKIIAYAAVTEGQKKLRPKVARLVSGDLAPLTPVQLSAFIFYMGRIKDAGVHLECTSGIADSLKANLTIYYNPLVLDADGKRLDGTNDTPVISAVVAFLKNQPFNGAFIRASLEDALQQVDGVVIPHINQLQATYGALPYTTIITEYLPDAGYLRVIDPTTDLTINYLPHGPI